MIWFGGNRAGRVPGSLAEWNSRHLAGGIATEVTLR
jgi:hypothetical protein